MQKEDKRLVEYRGEGQLRAYNARESEIAYLASKRILTQLETECAEKYRYYYERALLISRGNDLVTDYGCRIDGSKSIGTGEGRLDAIRELNRINKAIGERYVPILFDICGVGYTIKQFSNKTGIGPRKVSRLLKEGLSMAMYPLGLKSQPNTIR
tara:strand:+ start:1528 stop:1992 length:465 start_codon:yes stop_codon:yes gene_type:complete